MKSAIRTSWWRLLALICTALSLWLLPPPSTRAQSIGIWTEGFGSSFPGSTWTVGDDNSLNGSNYWWSVDSAYGGEGTFVGNFKGYCAARTPTGTNNTAIYPINMTSFASRLMPLTNVTRANVRFGYKVPSIGAGDFWRVRVDNTIFATGSSAVTNWTELSFNLNNFAGANRTLRFEFVSDASGTGEGMYIDDVRVTGANTNVTETFFVTTLNNYTGYVIDSDRTNDSPGYDREGLAVTTRVNAENFQTTLTNLPYRFTYWLRNTNGAQFPIRTFNGTTNAAQNYVATNVLSLGNGDLGWVTNSAMLLPIGRLSHLARYQIECEVARTNGTVLARYTNAPRQYYHFTNTVSGDASLNIIAEHTDADLERTWLMDTHPGATTFTVTNRAVFRRYDDFAEGFPGTDTVSVRFDLELRNATTDALVPLASSAIVTNLSIFAYQPFSTDPIDPRVATNDFRLEFRPSGQLNSVDAQYRLIVRMSYVNQFGQPAVQAESITNGPARFLHYNGTLVMNDVTGTMTNFFSPPAPNLVTPGSHIDTTIRLAVNGAYVNGAPQSTFGNTAALGARLQINGTAVLFSGAQLVNNSDSGTAGNIRFSRSGVVVDSQGARATSITFTMPSGFGWSTNIDLLNKRMLESVLTFNDVGLGQGLAPKTNLVLTAPAGTTLYTTEESKPFYMIGSALTWNAAASRFNLTPVGLELLHPRFLEYYILELQRTNLVSSTMADRRANDLVFNFVDKINGEPSITADVNGTARLSVDITFKTQGGFRTHFPYDATIVWTAGGGSLNIVNDAVTIGAGSGLTGVGRIALRYSSDCEGCGGSGALNLIGITPPDNQLRFTRDGGLVMNGAATPEYGIGSISNKVSWGYIPSKTDYAQSVLAPTNALFHMPGSFLLGANNTSSKEEDAPGVLLYTGVAGTNQNIVERPLTQAYKQGRADYAGLNVRVLGDSFRAGRSVIAGQLVNYQLRGNSKYYARLGGVSGRHSAVGGTFPETLTLLGYGMTFSNYSLAYLDSQNVDSRTEGLLRVPYPSNFELAFEELTFTCPGGLDSAAIQDGSSDEKLEWWDADFEALAIQFVTQPGEECDPGKGWLTVGVNGFAAHVPGPLPGVLGFKTNGTIIAASDNIADVDSRLGLPVSFDLAGPKTTNVNYHLVTVGKAYYAAYNADPNKVPQGFINFAAKMDVPFFEDIRVHAQVSGKKGPEGKTTLIYLMGGWPRPGSGEPNFGWREGSDDFFNKPSFDPSNRGFPSSIVQLVNYRNSGASTQYKPRAQKQWLDVVEFNYPLNWDSNARVFKSSQSVSNDLFIIKVKHEIKSLNPKTADLTFGASYEGVPRISVGSLIAGLAEESGALDAITDAIGNSDAGFLLEGLEAFGNLVSDSLVSLSKTIMDEAVEPLLDPTYNALKSAYEAAPANNKWAFTNDVNKAMSNFVYQATNKVLIIADYTKQGNVLLKDINKKLGEAEKGMGSAANALLKATNAPKMVAKAVSTFSKDAAANIGNSLSNFVEEINPFLLGASQTITNVKAIIPPIRAGLSNGGEYATQLDNIVKQAAPQIVNAAELARKEVIKYFMTSFDYSVDNPFTHVGKEQLKERLRKAFEEKFIQTALLPKIQSANKHRFYDSDASFRGGLDSFFTGINGLVRQVIELSAAPLDDAVNSALDQVRGYMGAAKLTGHALINEDSLRYLRIDGAFSFKVPEEVKFGAYVEIKEIDSENSFEGCTYAGGTATEIKLGAKDVPLQWISPGLKASIGVGWVLGADNTPRGVNGNFEMKGKLKFGGFTLKQIGFAVAFGEQENYLAANCRATINNSIQIAAGIFFGRACTYDPILTAIGAVSPFLKAELNPNELFGSPPFTGGFVFAEGTFPVWSYGCLFEIRLTVGGGGWYFTEGPRYGGIVKLGAEGTVACVLNGGFAGTVIGSQKDPDDGMVYVGTIRGHVSIGWCDFCIEEEDEAIWQKVGDGDFKRIEPD